MRGCSRVGGSNKERKNDGFFLSPVVLKIISVCERKPR